jgi:hypothetical protein
MASDSPAMTGSGDVPTVQVRDGSGRQLLCFLEQLIPLDGHDYALLTPVDTPVCLFRLSDDDDPELVETLNATEPISPAAITDDPVAPAAIALGTRAGADSF